MVPPLVEAADLMDELFWLETGPPGEPAQQSNTNQHRSLRSRWSSRTSSRISGGVGRAATRTPGGRPPRARLPAQPPAPP
jgi:hypothetical protein